MLHSAKGQQGLKGEDATDLHHKLMGTSDQGQIVGVIKSLGDVLAEGVPSSTRGDAPAAPVIRIRPQQIAHRTLQAANQAFIKSPDFRWSPDGEPTSCGTSWILSNALMWSSVSMEGDKPPCKQKIWKRHIRGYTMWDPQRDRREQWGLNAYLTIHQSSEGQIVK